MRVINIILCIIITLFSCQKESIFSVTSNNHGKIIALQPLGQYDVEQLELLSIQLSTFFNIRVIILQPIDIPETFRSSNKESYSADSLLHFLSKIKNDSIVEVIGVTDKQIYTFKKTKAKHGNNTLYLNEQIGVYGLGYLSGSTCVISDYKFRTDDKVLLNSLVRKVILHEIGHNLNLSHCSVETCVMAEADGHILNLMKLDDDYCKKCRQRIK